MNTPTLMASLVFAAILATLLGVCIHLMMRGWRNRAARQLASIGRLPALPDIVGAARGPGLRGLYVGSTLTPNWLERVATPELGYRSKAVLTRYPEGIMMQRSGCSPIWIPAESVVAIRTERGIAGKVVAGGGTSPTTETDAQAAILVIRWTLPSGTEIDTGFRADDQRQYHAWVDQQEDRS